MTENRSSLFVKILFITLASFIGTELLTGSTPVFPPTLLSLVNIFLLCLYGSGALIVREIAVIWNKGWFSILAFGAAFAIIEEGIALKTWFAADPGMSYARFMGVNWSFGIAETIVEAIFSIALPIILSRIAFRGSESERWLGTKGLVAAGIAQLVVVSMLFHATMSRFTDISTQLPLALIMTVAFVLIGFAIKSPAVQEAPAGMLASPKMLAPLYLFSTLAVFFFCPVWLTPFTPHPLTPVLSALVAVVVLIMMFAFLHRRLLSPRQLFAVVCGIASAMFLVSIFGPQRALGAPIGVVLYIIVLIFAWRRMRRAERIPDKVLS